MNERIFLNGAPVVGFGMTREEGEKRFYTDMLLLPIAGYFVGSIGGAFLGNHINKGLGTAIGAIAGGVVGGVSGVVLGQNDARKAAEEQKRLQEQQAATKP